MKRISLTLLGLAVCFGCASSKKSVPPPQAPVEPAPYIYPDSRNYADFVQKDCVRAEEKNEIVVLSNRHGTAQVSLYGANVFSYVPAGGSEVLFSTQKPDFTSSDFQHAGIPIVWPWFNQNGEAGSNLHGFARQMRWRVVEKSENQNVSSLLLEIVSTEETRRLWPYDFRLRYRIVLSDQLQLSLVTENTDSVPFSITEGFHSFFRVSDVNSVVLRGLDGCRNDQIVSDGRNPVFKGDLQFHAGEGRVFMPGSGEYVLFDKGLNRAIALAARGHRKLILWSIPKMVGGQFGEGDWQHFVCLEPSIISRDVAVTVLPGHQYELRMSIKAAALN